MWATPVDHHQADRGRVEMRRSYGMDALVEADVVVVLPPTDCGQYFSSTIGSCDQDVGRA